MGNANAKAERDKDRLVRNFGVLIPPLFGTGCDVWSPPPTRPMFASTPSVVSTEYYKSYHYFLRRNVLSYSSDGQDDFLESILYNPLSVCAPGMALLSKEHLRQGIWLSASTSNLDGKVLAHLSNEDSKVKLDTNTTEALFPNKGFGGLRIMKLFPRSKSESEVNYGHCKDYSGGVDFFVNIPTSSNHTSGASLAQLNTFYHFKLGRNLGYFMAHASAQSQSCDANDHTTNPPIELNHKELLSSGRNECGGVFGLQYANTIKLTSKIMLLNIGSNARWRTRSSNDDSNDIPMYRFTGGSLYGLCNCVTHGLLGVIQANFPPVRCRVENHLMSMSTADSCSNNPFYIFLRENVSSRFPTYFLNMSQALSEPSISCLLSFDLNRLNSAVSREPSLSLVTTGSPIVLTLQNICSASETVGIQQKNYSNVPNVSVTAITVSQVLSNDRIVTNPLEDRCNMIRNTVSWAVQLAQKKDVSIPLITRGESSIRTAIAWQTNRNLCYKAHFDTLEGFTFGILLKRWSHPRITLSLLFGAPINLSKGSIFGSLGFKGLCVQIETGPLLVNEKFPSNSTTSDYHDKFYDARNFVYQTGVNQDREPELFEFKETLPTRISLPKSAKRYK